MIEILEVMAANIGSLGVDTDSLWEQPDCFVDEGQRKMQGESRFGDILVVHAFGIMDIHSCLRIGLHM